MARETTPLRSEPTAEDLCEDGALTIPAGCKFSGLGRTTIYDLFREGRLHPIHVRGRTLIAKRELVELLADGMEDTEL